MSKRIPSGEVFSPDILANALQDQIHKDLGRGRAAKSVRTRDGSTGVTGMTTSLLISGWFLLTVGSFGVLRDETYTHFRVSMWVWIVGCLLLFAGCVSWILE